MINENDWQLILDHLSGEISGKEEAEFQHWLNSDPEHRTAVELLKKVWEAGEEIPPESDIQTAWLKIREQAGLGKHAPKIIPPVRKGFIGIPANSPLLRIAAVLLAVVGLSMLIGVIGGKLSRQQTVASNVIEVERGSYRRLKLPDGSRIVLDSGSRFTYPREFSREVREVVLEGEGYFEVTADTSRPFVISANNGLVRVVGTAFNVRSWQNSNEVVVAVTEGRVSFGARDTNSDQAVIISAGQLSVLNYQGKVSSPVATDIGKHLGWLNREADFENRPLGEILFQLERWYKLSFVLQDHNQAAERLTLHIRNDRVEDILDMISILTGLEYTIKADTVYLKTKAGSS